MKRFFIYCLPRSGSAWLANFLTAKDSYCFHDPLAYTRFCDLKARFDRRPETVVGAIDTGAYCFPGWVEAELPDTEFYVLERDPLAISRSSWALGIEFDGAANAKQLADTTRGYKRLQYDSIRTIEGIASIWETVIGPGFDRERALQLLEMNVQRDYGLMKARKMVNL